MAAPLIAKSLVVFLLLECFHGFPKSEAQVLEEEFSGKVVTDMAVNLPADELWAVFRSPDYLKLLGRLAPDFYRTVTYVTGDGGVGTIVNITIQPERGGGYWYDQITKLDDETKTRVLTHRQGNFRNAGFTLFESEYNIIEKEYASSTVRMTFRFELDQESLSNVSLVLTTWGPAITIANYVNSVRSTPVVLQEEFSGELVSDMKVNLPADELWEVYSRKNFSYLLGELMPAYLKQVEYICGDGGLGTVANITLQPAFGSTNWLEKLIIFDNATMTRVVRQIKGGNLDAGFTVYDSGFRVMQDTNDSSVIRIFTPFKIKPESVSNASALKPSWDATIAIVNYITSMKIHLNRDEWDTINVI